MTPRPLRRAGRFLDALQQRISTGVGRADAVHEVAEYPREGVLAIDLDRADFKKRKHGPAQIFTRQQWHSPSVTSHNNHNETILIILSFKLGIIIYMNKAYF